MSDTLMSGDDILLSPRMGAAVWALEVQQNIHASSNSIMTKKAIIACSTIRYNPPMLSNRIKVER